jgi:hypothetical protein
MLTHLTWTPPCRADSANTPFLSGEAFEPETIREMSLALESVCKTLGLKVVDDPATRHVRRENHRTQPARGAWSRYLACDDGQGVSGRIGPRLHTAAPRFPQRFTTPVSVRASARGFTWLFGSQEAPRKSYVSGGRGTHFRRRRFLGAPTLHCS